MNNTIIILHFGELTLKKKNYNFFFSFLINNVKEKIKKYNKKVKLIKEYQRLYIEILDVFIIDNLIQDLKHVFGLNSLSIAKKCKTNLEDIKKTSILFLNDLKDIKTFKIETKRINKNFKFTSLEISNLIGKYILQNKQLNLKVDVNNPNVTLKIEIRTDVIIIYYKSIKCYGGLPFGTAGIGLSMISGGIDSPVSSFLAMKKGLKLDFIHFATPPHTNEKSLQKIFSILNELKKFSFKSEIKLYVVNFTLLQNEIMHIQNESYRIVIMRRMFFRITNLIAKKYKLQTIITGESLGQVASQTIESLTVSDNVSEILILRPLISYDKNQIIEIAKQIHTYEISILPFEDCCSLFVPKNPITKPKIVIAISQEQQIMYKEIIKEIINNHTKVYNI